MEQKITIVADEDGTFSMDEFVKAWPMLKAAVSYKFFFNEKKKELSVRFYDKKRRWIRVKK